MPKVIVLGAGVAGLTAAHELIERSFDVTVVEADGRVGGRVRSQQVDGLPTEHGFHFVPGFYRHLPDTLSRIPAAGKKADSQRMIRQSVLDQLVASSRLVFAREGGSELPFDLSPRSLTDLAALTRSFTALGLQPAEIRLFVSKFVALLSALATGDDHDLDTITWWDFIEAGTQSKRYQDYFANVAVRWTVAMDPRKASARTIGRIALQFWRSSVASFANAPAAPGVDRVFNGPTSDVWLDPWYDYLKRRGVDFKLKTRVTGLRQKNGRICSVQLADGNSIDAFDYCICALPIDALSKILEDNADKNDFRDSDPQFQRIPDLKSSLEWMCGMQFYLKRDVSITRGGIMLRDSPWAITAISQLQYWNTKTFDWKFKDKSVVREPEWIVRNQRRAPQQVKGVISVIISNWNIRGDFQNLTAKNCTPAQLGREAWSELKSHLSNRPRQPDETPLTDDDLVAWSIPLEFDEKAGWKNDQKLFLNTVGSRENRPEVTTCLDNFFLAGDYVRTDTDLACMEAANESARRAVVALLDEAEWSDTPPTLWPLDFGVAQLGAASLAQAIRTVNTVGASVVRESMSLFQSLARFGRTG